MKKCPLRLGSDSERAKVLGCWRLLRSGTAPNNCELRQLHLNDNSRPLAALRGLATNQMLQDLGDNASILKNVRTRAKLAWATQRLLPASAQPIVCQQCHEPCFMPLALRCASRFSVSLKKQCRQCWTISLHDWPCVEHVMQPCCMSFPALRECSLTQSHGLPPLPRVFAM